MYITRQCVTTHVENGWVLGDLGKLWSIMRVYFWAWKKWKIYTENIKLKAKSIEMTDIVTPWGPIGAKTYMKVYLALCPSLKNKNVNCEKCLKYLYWLGVPRPLCSMLKAQFREICVRCIGVTGQCINLGWAVLFKETLRGPRGQTDRFSINFV